MVNSAIYEKVTYKQIDDMKHAIGFDKRKVRGTKHRRYEPDVYKRQGRHKSYFLLSKPLFLF